MKKYIFACIVIALLAAGAALSMASCKNSDENNKNGGDTDIVSDYNGNNVTPNSDGNDESNTALSSDENDEGNTTPNSDENITDETQTDDNNIPTEYFEYSQEALNSIELVQNSIQNNSIIAAAYLGTKSEDDSTELTEWLWNNVPAMMETLPFLVELPSQDIIGTYGDLYCVIPRGNDVSLVVNRLEWKTLGNGAEAITGEALYENNEALPFLVFVNHDPILDNETDVEINISTEDGNTMSWHPLIDHETAGVYTGYLSKPIWNFADLCEVGTFGPDAEMLPPTEIGISGKWLAENGWMLHIAYDATTENGSGGIVLYQPVTVEDGTTALERYCHGIWWLDDGKLCFESYTFKGEAVCGQFDVLLNPAGELFIYEAADGTRLPFFNESENKAILEPIFE